MESSNQEQTRPVLADSNRPRMTVADRAKQFAPFAALTGLTKALASMETIIVDRPILSDEALLELDEKMKQLQKGNLVTLIHYYNGQCIKTSGMVAKIEQTSRMIQIVNTRISFDNILDIIPEE